MHEEVQLWVVDRNAPLESLRQRLGQRLQLAEHVLSPRPASRLTTGSRRLRQPITVPLELAFRGRVRLNADRSTRWPVCSPTTVRSPWTSAAMMRPATGAFLNWLPLVPIA